MSPSALALAAALAAAPACAQDALAEWVFRTEAETAQLAVGGMGVGLVSLTCHEADGRVGIYAELPELAPKAETPTSARLVSGMVTSRVAAKIGPLTDAGGAWFNAELPLATPALAEFARSGRLRIETSGAAATPSPAPKDRVRDFFAVCKPGYSLAR